MDNDFDIYEDLSNYDIKDDENPSKNNEALSKECEELKKEVNELKEKLENLQKVNETLEVNLSSLLKTAKAEITRKDKMIDELRKQVDNMSFRRGHFNRNVKDINDKSMQQLPVQNLHEYSHVQQYSESERTSVSNLQNLNSNNDKYNSVASSSSDTTFQNSSTVNCNHPDEDQVVSDYESYNDQFCNTRYQSKKLQVPYMGSTTVFTERLRKRIMEEEAEQKRKLLEEEDKTNLLSEDKDDKNTKINIDDKENHSYCSILNLNVDDTSLKSKEAVCNFIDNTNIPKHNDVSMTNQQRPALNIKVSEKRLDNVDTHFSKRRKLDIEQNLCPDKNSLPVEDAFNEYDHGIISSTKTDKLNCEENSNSYIERNTWNDNKYDKGTRSNNTAYRRKEKEYYKKFNNDYNNYSKESILYYEKNRYNHTRSRSPLPKYFDRKHKYHDDRYRNYRDRFDRRRNSQDKEEDTLISSDRRSYDLRNKDKNRSTEKYGTTDFNSSINKGSKYSISHVSRSVSHERSRSRERTNHKIYDRRYLKSTRHDKNSEERENIFSKKKSEINESKGIISLSKKKNDISDKSIKTNTIDEILEDGEIVSPIKSNLNNKTKEIKDISNVETHKDSLDQFENVSKFSDEVNTRICLKKTYSKNIEYKKKKIDQVEKDKDIIVAITTTSEEKYIPLVENKQDCMVTSTNNIIPLLICIDNDIDKNDINEEKCDKEIVQLEKASKEADSTCDMQNFPEDISRTIKEISVETIRQESNIICKYNDEIEEESISNTSNVDIVKDNVFFIEKHKTENDISKDKYNMSDNNYDNQVPILNDQQEPLVKVHQEVAATTQDLQGNEEDNSENEIVKVKASKNNKKEGSESENSKVIIFARRRKHVQLTDNNASMTVVINPNNINSDVNVKNSVESNLKLRACKVSRSYKDVLLFIINDFIMT
ncbi:putative uncharacterized protein DDB_G0282133 [Vespa velutina]|uniref:putative uncharacterized protein DDB_G0282133 n=1 Tax=Vespa velutina TaxID=202808 RepID=UPI001FB41D84|nr:putative uncharacterized protein DDB_G0282133 [Vespa velutina]